MATKLEHLLIKEVSGVDDPANEIPGWMVAKAKSADKPYGDVKYADPGYQEDGKERYPLDTEEHIRAAWSYINQKDNADLYSAEQLKEVKGKIAAAMKKIGADVTKEAEATSIVEKIKQILHGKEDLEMTKEELNEELDARFAAFGEILKSLLPSAPEAPAEGAAVVVAEAPAPAVVEPETAPAVEAVAKGVTAEELGEELSKAIEPVLAIIEPMIDRLERLEKGGAIRKSLDGQEGASTEDDPKEPELGDAIKAAFRRPQVVNA